MGSSGVGKSCILRRFVKGDWNVLTSQTIGVEFSSKTITVGTTDNNTVKMKLQLWDTAGQERFRSLTRSYYRGSAAAVLVYDICDHKSFESLHEYMTDLRSLTVDSISLVVVGNKSDLVGDMKSRSNIDPTSIVTDQEALDFCSYYSEVLGVEIPFIKASALLYDNVDYIFDRISSLIISKVEMGLVDPEDPVCGIQYGNISRLDTRSEDNLLECIHDSRGDDENTASKNSARGRSNNRKLNRRNPAPTTISLISRGAGGGRGASMWRCC